MLPATAIVPLIIVSSLAVPYLVRRLELSLAKHASLAGHSGWSRRVARWVPFYEYDDAHFFRADGASIDIADRRRGGFVALTLRYEALFAKSLLLTRELEASVSDLQLISRYRVPFQFSRYLCRRLRSAALCDDSAGTTVRDLDGNTPIDLSGSYGVNTFGYAFYKKCIAQGTHRVSALGPVLGVYHPIAAYNVRRLRAISGLDEVSFHMSGTEAVMQAVRLARYHSRRRFVVRFCGAYHGWWGDVQPGIGNPATARDTYTLKENSEATLRVLRRRNDVACVLVNPLQAMHLNHGAPSDSTLVDSARSAAFDREAYACWLRRLREVCSLKKIALVFDEVFVGFRIAGGGAQEYFGVSADLVTYGKTVGGGLPVGVLCGRSEWMRRYRNDRPADICLARGTFNAHPHVMGAMYEFLRRLDTPRMQSLYVGLDQTWNRRAIALNSRFESAGLPVRVVNFSTIWTMIYTQPSRYNWMLQFYLRARGIALSWVGTGRLLFSLDFTQAEFDAAADRIFAAALEMQADGWWSSPVQLTNRAIRRKVLLEMLQVTCLRLMGTRIRSRNNSNGAL